MPEGLTPGPEFLKDRYWSREEFREEVSGSAAKAKRLDPKLDISQKPVEQIPYYLERLERITTREDSRTGERGRLFLEKSIYPRYIVQPENISDEYIKGILLGNFAERLGYEPNDLSNEDLKNQILKQFAKETGQELSSYLIPSDERERVREMVTSDQRARLNEWFDYLTSPEAHAVPAAFRYWAFAEMLKLGSFDEERKVFNRRTETTAASFPELNQQALSLAFDEIERKRTGEPSTLTTNDEESQSKFREYLKSENFGKLYAFMLDHVNSLRLPEERLPITSGEWCHFPKGTDAKELTKTLQGFNTKWCIAGEGYAGNYLTHSDLYIYYSEDKDGLNTIPRACIVHSEEHGITEVRGIMSSKDAKQHLDDYITPIVEEKLSSLPGGDKWRGTMADMKLLAKIHFKHLQNTPLNKEELIFLYEIDQPIQSTGYQRDPRIDEIKRVRNPKEDAPVVLDCQPNEIIWNESGEEISFIPDNTKAYIGTWNIDMFNTIKNHPNIKHLYESFPSGKIFLQSIETNPIINSPETVKRALREKNDYLTSWGEEILQKTEFSQESQKYNLVRFAVSELGFPKGATTDQIYARAIELGLELCPAEVGPHLRLQYRGNERMAIAMKQIPDRDGDPDVFGLSTYGAQLGLDGSYASPARRWGGSARFVFQFRQVSQGS